MSFSISLLGASGLIGQHCLKMALEDHAIIKVNAIGRRSLDIQHEKLTQSVCDLGEIPPSALTSDCLICCLGTTIKLAGNKQAFKRVDYDYVCQAAEQAIKQGTDAMIVVSAVGADKDSSFFYNQVKGEMEQTLQSLGFRSLYIIRPSLLLGQRPSKRLAEDLSKPLSRALSPLLIGSLKRYQPVEGHDVARQIVKLCKVTAAGVHIVYPTL